MVDWYGTEDIMEQQDRASGYTYIGEMDTHSILGGVLVSNGSEIWDTGGSITSLLGICATNRIHNVCQLPLGVSLASTITALR